MELTTSWMRKGIKIGEAQGIQQGEVKVVSRLLRHRLGQVTPSQQAQIERLTLAQLEDLSIALLDFRETQDLTNWLGLAGGN